MSFRALVLQQSDKTVTSSVESLDDDRLPDGDVTVRVEHSGVNYKDGLIVRGLARLVRTYPHVPGIDLAGVVEASMSARFAVGDRVVSTGWRVGEAWWGGFAERAKLRSEWLVKVPDTLSTRDAMVIGTAGLTSAMAIEAIEAHGARPGDGVVLVTGATGGVGSIAVHLLAKLGYEVAASTGKPDNADALKQLGATSVIDRNEIASAPDKPLLPERWAACIDAVGGPTLAHVLAELRYGGTLAACGNTAGVEFPGNVIPFLLRGTNVLGIESVNYPTEQRVGVWQRIADIADMSLLSAQTREIGLADLPAAADEILAGKVAGRLLVTP